MRHLDRSPTTPVGRFVRPHGGIEKQVEDAFETALDVEALVFRIGDEVLGVVEHRFDELRKNGPESTIHTRA